jgi:hypothetical protein
LRAGGQERAARRHPSSEKDDDDEEREKMISSLAFLFVFHLSWVPTRERERIGVWERMGELENARVVISASVLSFWLGARVRARASERKKKAAAVGKS